MSNDCSDRAMLLTPPGSAAIAVVRIAGTGVPAFLTAHFSRSTAPGKPTHGELREGEKVIDDPVVVRVDETTADLNLHAGLWVIHATLDLLARSGFQVIQPAPIPLPDWAINAVDPIEGEALAVLPLAKTELAVRVILEQSAAWRRLLSMSPSDEMLRSLLADCVMDRLLHPPTVAIVGPANVGKSTLANQLFGRERSITADLPGTTRDWVGEMADLNGVAVLLIDTPGLRETSDPIEREAIARARQPVAQADVVVVVLDGSRPLDPEQEAPLRLHAEALIVLNKVDRPPAFALANLGAAALPIVATTGQGIEALREAILRKLECDKIDVKQPRCWTTRQKELISRLRRVD